MTVIDDWARIQHIKTASREVIQFTNGKTRASLDEDLLLVRGLCMSIGIIGEAASRSSVEFRAQYPHIPFDAR